MNAKSFSVPYPPMMANALCTLPGNSFIVFRWLMSNSKKVLLVVGRMHLSPTKVVLTLTIFYDPKCNKCFIVRLREVANLDMSNLARV